jgi:hypothetical protein
MTNITLNLPETILVGGPAGHDKPMATAAWTAEFVLDMALHGLKQRRTDRFSVVKSGKGEAEALEALAELDARLIAGEIPAGGGGGGARLTAEEAGWVEYFKSKDSPVKFKGETPNGKSLQKYLEALTKKAIQGSIRAKLEGLDKNDQVKFHLEEVPAMIAKALPILKAREEALTGKGTPGWFIQVEKDKRNGKQTQDSIVAPLDIEF